MIPVAPRPEPASFDREVRQPGLAWLARKGIPPATRLPPGTKMEPYWRGCLDELHHEYAGVCSYLCVFVERCTGGSSVDHFVAKSRLAKLAYEWSNYRLACSTMNARKRDFDTVLDPFTLRAGTFRLELVSGRIYPNPRRSVAVRSQAQTTIARLGLDDPGCREMRARWYEEYRLRPLPEAYLRRYSPFVWAEARRQGLL